jgi:hypothetical protein
MPRMGDFITTSRVPVPPDGGPSRIVLALIAVAFAAVCVWLTVRIVNRRERWAKWTLAGVAVVLALYPFSYGPFLWLEFRGWLPDPLITMGNVLYLPINGSFIRHPDWYAHYLGRCMMDGQSGVELDGTPLPPVPE